MSNKQNMWKGKTAKEAMSQVPGWGFHCKLRRNTQIKLKNTGEAMFAIQYYGMYKITKLGTRDYVVTNA